MKKTFSFIIALISFNIFAQSGEFLVNSTINNSQRSPKIVKSDGVFCVVWQSENEPEINTTSEIYFQVFNLGGEKINGEIKVNTQSGVRNQFPAVNINSSGKMVVVWANDNPDSLELSNDIRARRYDNFVPVGEDFIVNETNIHSQNYPSVALFENGNFIVVWESWFQDRSDKGVYGQMFDSTGAKLGSEVLINSTTQYSQCRPVVKIIKDNRFAVMWEAWSNAPPNYDVMCKVFNANFDAIVDEFRVNEYTVNYQWQPDFAVDSKGNIYAVWCSWEQDGDDGGIYAVKFDRNFNRITEERLINLSTRHYQWTPRINICDDDKVIIVWSSWLTDGENEGVYGILLDTSLFRLSVETRINDYTQSYQWEPDFVILSNYEIATVWSSWRQYSNEYDIILKKLEFIEPFGAVGKNDQLHISGASTTSFNIFAVDSLSMVNASYLIEFDSVNANLFLMNIKRETDDSLMAENFPIINEPTMKQYAPLFDGIIVEIEPEFKLEINPSKSYFKNLSGSNIVFNVGKPTVGVEKVAPMDVILQWTAPIFSTGGILENPLDTAYNTSLVKNVLIPFKAHNLSWAENLEVIVRENSGTKNNQWDPTELILLRTPASLRTNNLNVHCQLASTTNGYPITYLYDSDSIFVYTRRPLSKNDKYRIIVNKDNLVFVEDDKGIAVDWILYQNYPNPFNNSSAIEFYIPNESLIELKVYDILGREAAVLANETLKEGRYKYYFEGKNLASGVYLYALTVNGFTIVKKALLLK